MKIWFDFYLYEIFSISRFKSIMYRIIRKNDEIPVSRERIRIRHD